MKVLLLVLPLLALLLWFGGRYLNDLADKFIKEFFS